MRYICELCGNVYDEAQGDVKRGIPSGTRFLNLPSDVDCPICGSHKEAFTKATKAIGSAPSEPNQSADSKYVKYFDDHCHSSR